MIFPMFKTSLCYEKYLKRKRGQAQLSASQAAAAIRRHPPPAAVAEAAL